MNKSPARLYSAHDEILGSRALACRPGCSVCCTDRVLATEMEARAVYDELRRLGRDDLLARIAETARQGIYRPGASINEMAQMCMERREPPPEPEAAISACPLLGDGLCAVYPVRPLACRAQVSETPCRPGGEAVTDELTLTLNQVFFQAAEHLDQGGLSGNLLDLLARLDGRGGREHLRRNRPLPGLLVPPEHFEKARELMEKLMELLK